MAYKNEFPACPVCWKTAIVTCGCTMRESQCENGHWWHTNPKKGYDWPMQHPVEHHYFIPAVHFEFNPACPLYLNHGEN